MGFQFLGPRSRVLSPSDPRPPAVRDTIVVLASGHHCCIGLGGVGFAPSNEDLAFRDGVCHLMNLFLRAMFKLRQGPVQFLGFFWPLSKKNSSWNDPDFGTILVPFSGPGTLPGNDFLPFARLPCSASWARKNAFCGWVQMKQVLAVRVGAKKGGGAHCVEEVVAYCTWYDRRSGKRSPLLHWAGRRWVRTFKRRFGISRWRLPLDEPFSAGHVQAKAGPGPIFGTFFGHWARRILLETTQILEPFWFLFLGRELYQVTTFYHLLDYLAAQAGPEKMHFVAECRWNKS